MGSSIASRYSHCVIYVCHMQCPVISFIMVPFSITSFDLYYLSRGLIKTISNYIHAKQWDAITHPCHTFNCGLVKPPLQLGHSRESYSTWNTRALIIGSASLARSIRIRFHFRHRTGRIRSVSDHRAGRVWRSRHRSKTPNCLPGARDQVPALFRNAIERRGASVDSNSGAPITQSTFNMLRRMANLLSLLNWWLHRYDNEDDYALFQV